MDIVEAGTGTLSLLGLVPGYKPPDARFGGPSLIVLPMKGCKYENTWPVRECITKTLALGLCFSLHGNLGYSYRVFFGRWEVYGIK